MSDRQSLLVVVSRTGGDLSSDESFLERVGSVELDSGHEVDEEDDEETHRDELEDYTGYHDVCG